MKIEKFKIKNISLIFFATWLFFFIANTFWFSSIWIIPVTFSLLFLAIFQVFNFEKSLILSLSLFLALVILYQRVAIYFFSNFETSTYFFLFVVALTSVLFSVFKNGKSVDLRFQKASARTQVMLVISSIFIVGFFTYLQSGGSRIAWAMKNDAVWSTVMIRLVLEDGGINSSIRSISSPLTSGLFAQSISLGRDLVASNNLLRHDLLSISATWLLLYFAAALLTAWVFVREISSENFWKILVAASFGVFIQLSWYSAGFSFELGFYNTVLPIISLLIIWAAWRLAEKSYAFALVVLSLNFIVLLASWAPLGSIPFALIVYLIFRNMKSIFSNMFKTSNLLILSAMCLPFFYVLFVSIPDFLAERASLGADGGIVNVSPGILISFAILGLVITFLKGLVSQHWNAFIGFSLLAIVTFFTLVFLALFRTDSQDKWGYYSAKFGWLISIVVIVVIVSELVSWPKPEFNLSFYFSKISLVSAIVTLGLLSQIPPLGLKDVTPLTLMNAVLPLTQTYGFLSDDVEENQATLILDRADPNKKYAVFNYFETNSEDLFVNNWLLQLQSEKGEDPIRSLAYTLDGTQITDLCLLPQYWEGKVVVLTKNSNLENELISTCKDAKEMIEIRR